MTQDAFDQIAAGWYGFRHYTIFRRELEELAGRWPKGKLLNIGCAHGPDFLPFKEGFQLYGVDSSGEMLRLAKKYARKFALEANLVQADARCLPFKDDSFDRAIAVATYHHLREEAGRLGAFKELWRVLQPGGEAFITVWNRWQPRFWLKGREVNVPWRSREKVVQRYYYLFSYPELERLVRKAGLKVVKSFPERAYRFPLKLFSRNICLLVRKEG